MDEYDIIQLESDQSLCCLYGRPKVQKQTPAAVINEKGELVVRYRWPPRSST